MCLGFEGHAKALDDKIASPGDANSITWTTCAACAQGIQVTNLNPECHRSRQAWWTLAMTAH